MIKRFCDLCGVQVETGQVPVTGHPNIELQNVEFKLSVNNKTVLMRAFLHDESGKFLDACDPCISTAINLADNAYKAKYQ